MPAATFAQAEDESQLVFHLTQRTSPHRNKFDVCTEGFAAVASDTCRLRIFNKRRLDLGRPEGHLQVAIEGNAGLFWLLS